jgi:hypothetical protein
MQQASYRGSPTTFALVKDQIAERWGEEAADSYDPKLNCFTLKQWNARGFKVKKGEKSLRSFTIMEEENKKRWRKSVFLFFHIQVEEIKSS